MPEWDAEVVVDEALVRALLAEQFPELDACSARLIGEGWDNSVWVVEERWAFRFPRRSIAIPGVQRELDVLPRLAPLLAVPVPEPRFVGQPNDRFPWPFFGALMLPGREPADADVTDDERVELGAALGRLLRTLHSAETLAAVDPDHALPVDFNRRADMPNQVLRARQSLPELSLPEPGRVAAILAEAELLPPSRSKMLVHGDLHIRHVLVDSGSIAGVIDWGDVCVGDPSIDLQVAWSLLSADARSQFFEEYGPIDEERALRARVLAIRLCAMLALYARSVGYANLERESLSGIERALVD